MQTNTIAVIMVSISAFQRYVGWGVSDRPSYQEKYVRTRKKVCALILNHNLMKRFRTRYCQEAKLPTIACPTNPYPKILVIALYGCIAG